MEENSRGYDTRFQEDNAEGKDEDDDAADEDETEDTSSEAKDAGDGAAVAEDSARTFNMCVVAAELENTVWGDICLCNECMSDLPFHLIAMGTFAFAQGVRFGLHLVRVGLL